MEEYVKKYIGYFKKRDKDSSNLIFQQFPRLKLNEILTSENFSLKLSIQKESNENLRPYDAEEQTYSHFFPLNLKSREASPGTRDYESSTFTPRLPN